LLACPIRKYATPAPTATSTAASPSPNPKPSFACFDRSLDVADAASLGVGVGPGVAFSVVLLKAVVTRVALELIEGLANNVEEVPSEAVLFPVEAGSIDVVKKSEDVSDADVAEVAMVLDVLAEVEANVLSAAVAIVVSVCVVEGAISVEAIVVVGQGEGPQLHRRSLVAVGAVVVH
jgi:hypothetical protein